MLPSDAAAHFLRVGNNLLTSAGLREQFVCPLGRLLSGSCQSQSFLFHGGLRLETAAAISDASRGVGSLFSGLECESRMPPQPRLAPQSRALAASQSLRGSAELPGSHPAPHAFFLLALRARRLVGNQEDVSANCSPDPRGPRGLRSRHVPGPLLLAARPSLRGMGGRLSSTELAQE